MSSSIYVAATEAFSGRTQFAAGLIDAFKQKFSAVGVFQPIVADGPDSTAVPGVTYDEVRANTEEAFTTLIERFAEVAQQQEAVVILGSDYTGNMSATELTLNARVAANLDAPVLLIVPAAGRTPEEVRLTAENARAEFAANHAFVVAVVATDVRDAEAAAVVVELEKLEGVLTAVIPAAPIDVDALLAAVQAPRTPVITPLAFQHKLMDMARSELRTIVLPEADDDRILIATDILLRRGVAKLILIGDPAEVAARAATLGLNILGATIIDPTDEALREQFATEYQKLRAHKGMTMEKALVTMEDPSYFGTMMVHLGMADGMVSGANHTTANTILPSLEFIKTRPGVSVVSGAFLMCMPDKVMVYADCAVNPNPTPEALAGIAISSAETAVKFGITPRVAMLSYSTGTSGSGADVDQVLEATRIARETNPELALDGPLQFDAAVNPVVARTKLPDSPVAGQATVLVFPDLNTGNNTYKAVQRTSGALAVGPLLQGLNKPVNDLSRGALVEDIVNTVAMTAIQAQSS